MLLLNATDISKIIKKNGISNTIKGLYDQLHTDFCRWNAFSHSPRLANYFQDGVIELMPITDDKYYSFKYVNGHPSNPKQNKLSIIALGMLAATQSGFPLILSDMTILTALRTAATSALAANVLARKNSKKMAIIGTGAQSEFQALAMHSIIGIDTIYYYDIDPNAMFKFNNNLKPFSLNLIPCTSIDEAVDNVDIITTATAHKAEINLISNQHLKPGIMLNCIGGDCPGKSELDPILLSQHRIVVDYLNQAKIEGEIQHIKDYSDIIELWKILTGQESGRQNDEEIIIFDSVGCAIEDFSALSYIYQLAIELDLGVKSTLLPELKDPKDLFSLIEY